jgi:hypothetical protein
MARASHMRIAMHNNTKFIAISLDNLDTVTGGYRDADPPTQPHGPDAPEGRPQGTLSARLGAILHHFADLASRPASQK